MSLSIRQATIRKADPIEIIALENMTKELYHVIQNYLYCPNLQCNARIEYASGDKRTFFRTKRSIVNGENIIEQHITDCPYSVEHEDELTRRKKYDPSIYVGISDKHIDDALSRAYKKHIDPNYGKKKNIGDNTTKSRSRQSKQDDSSGIRGKASLTVAIEDNEKKPKEPSIFHRNINDINEKDYGTVRTVSGEMIDFIITDKYKYITVKMDDGRSGRMYFGELFQVNNEVQYRQIDAYKSYLDKQKQGGKNVFVA